MTVDYRILTLNAGMTIVGSGFLLYSSILKIKREGIGFDRIGVLDSWRPRTFKHQPSHGLLLFNPAEPGATGGEKVYILYKR